MSTSYVKVFFCCLLPLLLLAVPAGIAWGSQPEHPAEYQLAISFDLENGILTGTAKVQIAAGDDLNLRTDQLTITGILLKRQDTHSPEPELHPGPVLHVPASQGGQELFISFTLQPGSGEDNLITPQAITLLSGWYPLPDRKMRYQLSALLPEHFTAITESATFPLVRHGQTVTAAFPHALSAIHFAAAPYVTAQLTVRDDLQVHTLFFPEDGALARDYLARAKDYILRYEKEIGPFPYNYYAIVANTRPTGLGMPTFTLLGQAVLRLPFIKDTSLGHEILHCWFGNSVEVDSASGNWAEGLTAYLADHAFRDDLGEGADYRLEAILNHLSYVHENTVIPLAAFRDASHSQPLAQARRAVGYSRAMLLFHELRLWLGHDRFMAGIRAVYNRYRHGSASWDDLENTFTGLVPKTDLAAFFHERLTRTDIPSFHAEDITISQTQDGNHLKFQLVQTTPPYSLKVVVRVTTARGDTDFLITLTTERTAVSLQLPERPLAFTLDPDSALLRTLTPAERPAIWSRFLGSQKRLVILQSPAVEATFRPLLDVVSREGQTVTDDTRVANTDLGDADLLILGLEQQAARNLFASPSHPPEGFTLDVRRNPLNPERVAVLVSSASAAETAAAASRLSHYGKYGYLHFTAGRAADKEIPTGDRGINYRLEQLSAGGATSQLNAFATIADALSQRDVIYIGETHTSASDHRLQLRLLEALAARIPDLAIGMEMFPVSSQPALDAYVLGSAPVTEKEFLQASRYFEVWQYDFRYFREIFALARQKKIPVVGLNLEREIVSTVFKTGGTDALDQAVRDQLVPDRALDLPGYGERLQLMHDMHAQGGHGNGLVSGFIQAQALWDETMAETIVNHLKRHPGRKMVVLAGTQHTRKDSGIPPRVARRMTVDQATVVNIAESVPPDSLRETADYYFFSEPLELAAPVRMGIMLEERTGDTGPYVEITGFSPESKAPAAGLRQHDIIRTIAAHPITTMAGVRIAMVDMQSAESVRVSVERKGTSSSERLEMVVELSQPSQEKPHP